jgi:uncharacterized RDD family membrane protein YckC
MGSALLDTGQLDTATSSDSPSAATHAAVRTTEPPAATEALHRQVAERLAAHRSRRNQAQPALAFPPAPTAPSRTSRIAAAVAKRYAHSPSYRAYLAAEAERATQQAQAAAQIATLNAHAVAQAQQLLLDSLNDEAPSSPGTPSSATAPSSPKVGSTESRSHHAPANSQPFATPIAVRIFEDDGLPASMLGAENRPLASPLPGSSASHLPQQLDRNDAEARLLDEEIAFRQSPVFEEPVGPPMPLPTNLIEFPRQLVAPRKARPRYAEGPLRNDDSPAPGESQLRIFEVDSAQISTTPVPAEAPAPQWTSIWLDAPGPGPAEAAPTSSLLSSRSDDYLSSRTLSDVEAEGPAFSSARPAPLPQIASIPRRLMAAAIDISVLLAGFLAFAAAFLVAAGRSNLWQSAAAIPASSFPLDRHPGLARLAGQFTAHTGLQPGLALASSVLVLVLLYLLYQALFFSFSESTPGMRCARIALCTFDDENPTRGAMRRRNLAVLLSACPLGLGLLWAAFDEDRLTWHDRLTRTYQRIY